MMLCIGCEWRLKPDKGTAESELVTIERYDLIESRYLSTGDFSALQQMNTVYPMETRTLIEDVLRIGHVNEPDINGKFLRFFQDSTLQVLVGDVQKEYADISDISEELSKAFAALKDELPAIDIPRVYTQIGSFDQSIIICGNSLGISLDKYLGADYPFYQNHYTDRQRSVMNRSMIVPDCLGFYLLSQYPMPKKDSLTQRDRDEHMGCIQWVVNQVTGRDVFDNEFVKAADKRIRKRHSMNYHLLLRNS
jgi:hypothetical protein